MPEYSQVQLIVLSKGQEILHIIERFNSALERICKARYYDVDRIDTRKKLDGDSAINALTSSYRLNNMNKSFLIKAHINELEESNPDDSVRVFELAILFETEAIYDFKNSVIIPEALNSIKRCIYVLSETFKGMPVFFTDEADDGKAAYAYLRKKGNVWKFDCALVSDEMNIIFTNNMKSKPTHIVCEQINEKKLNWYYNSRIWNES